MQKSWIHYTKEVFVTQMNHWILVVAALTLQSVFAAANLHVAFLLLLGVVPAYFYLLRLKTRHFSVFLLLHLLPLCFLLLCKSDILLFLLTAAILIVHFVYSIKTKVKPAGVENPFIGPASGVCCIAVCALLHSKYGKIDIGGYYSIALFAFLLVFFLYYFMDHYVWFINVQKNSVDNVSEQSLWIGGLKQLFPFIGITAVCMLLLGNIEWLSFLVSKVGALGKMILRFLFSLISRNPNNETTVYDNMTSGSGDEGGTLLRGGESGIVWIVLEYIAIAATIIGLTWLVIYGIVNLFQFLRNAFYQNKSKQTELLVSGTDVREQCEIIQTENYFKKLFSLKNNRDIARKAYKKFIIKHKEALIGDLEKDHLAPLTAGECCEKLQRTDVQQLYEKVRYSDEKISSADVKALKEKTKL